jgi:hypothetical protein
MQPLIMEDTGAPRCRRSWNVRKREEFCADVFLVAKRNLDATEWAVFRFHHMLGAEWTLCARKLGMDKGAFFNAVYRIERKLGRVFVELKPFALFPTDEYFHVVARSVDVRPFPVPEPVQANGTPLRPPLCAALPARRAPVQLPCEPKPVPVVVPLAIAAGDVPGYCRGLFGKGRTLRTIAQDLERHNVPAPNGKTWTEALVRGILLNAPSGPRLRRAA